MLKLLFRLKRVIDWLRNYLTEADIQQLFIHLAMVLLLFYIASKLTGFMSVIGMGGSLLYGGYLLWTKYLKSVFEKIEIEQKNAE